MRRSCATLVLLGACSGAPARTSSTAPVTAAAVTSAPVTAAPVIVHRLEFTESEADECSQSFSAGSTTGLLVLELAAERARLRFDAEQHESWTDTSGGSGGGSQQRQYALWAGELATEGEALVVRLELIEQRCVALPRGAGGEEVARVCLGFDAPATALTLRCMDDTVEATHGPDGGELAPRSSATSSPALRCVSAGPLPMAIESLGMSELVFPKSALRWRHERMPWEREFRGFVVPAP